LVPDPPAGGAQARRPRIALYPPQNLSGRAVSLREIEEAVELSLRSRGLDVVAGDAVRRAMAVHRIRYTKGLDRQSARAMREELGVDAVLVTSVLFHDPVFPPRFAIDLRLVSTEEKPAIIWDDGFARGGMDSPGLLGLTVVRDMEMMRPAGLNQLGDSLLAQLDGKGSPVPRCGKIKPRVIHRSKTLDGPRKRTVAVLPFVNQTDRRDAGDAVALEVIRELLATGRFQVVEPGLVRDELLTNRLIVEGGASLDTARVIGADLKADVLMAGYVREYEDLPGLSGPPRIELTVYAIDGRSGEVLWWSNSRARGDDGVFFFGLGRVSTAAELACGLGRGIAERMAGDPDAKPVEPRDPRAKGAPDDPGDARRGSESP
jgi:TolB-like protein